MFFGREELMSQLEFLCGKRVASFVSCRGRRRVGKSTLIERFAVRIHARFIKIEGVKPTVDADNETELKAFASQLAMQTGAERTTPEDWLNAFVRLDREIRDDVRTVVLLDEISWLAFDDRLFASTLKVAWDNYLKKHDKLIFVVCGSVSTWIRENIIDNGAFYGRRSLDMVVPELPLSECAKFWGDALERIPTREVFDVLAVTGGIPKYLEEVNPSVSASENLRRMCFLPKAPLREDFDDMFTDVITKQPKSTAKVLRALVGGSRTVSEIASQLGVVKSGNVTDSLQQLEEAGIVSRDVGMNPLTGGEMREKRFRIRDNYTRFYLKYIEPGKAVIDSGSFMFSGVEALGGWDSVMGLAFENLVVNHYRDLVVPLHLDRAIITSAAPYLKRGSEKSNTPGCQVDLLIQTQDSVYLVEIKRRNQIGAEVIDEMKAKVATLPRPADKSVRTALVYDGELAPVVEARGYFDAVVPFRRLLGI